jgi:hypothetical protein
MFYLQILTFTFIYYVKKETTITKEQDFLFEIIMQTVTLEIQYSNPINRIDQNLKFLTISF